MAPTRNSRSVNTRYSDYAEIAPFNLIGVTKRSGKKGKLSDMIGSPWTNKEAERFYKAYRKYGEDWNKVAEVVRTRTAEMVEALYLMHRGYLSLPEGTADVHGFNAMVSEYFAIHRNVSIYKDDCCISK